MANLIFNEAALHLLLQDPAGPVGLELRRVSENVTQLAQDNATKVLVQMPRDLIGYEITTGDDGLQSVIGVKGSGRFSDYLAAKEKREKVIFAPALDAGLHL